MPSPFAYPARPMSYGYPMTSLGVSPYMPMTAPQVPTYTPVYYYPVPVAVPRPAPPEPVAASPAPIVEKPTAAPITPPVIPPPVPITTTPEPAATETPALKPTDTLPNKPAEAEVSPKSPRELHREKILKAADIVLKANPDLQDQVSNMLPDSTLDEVITAKGDPQKLIQVAVKAALETKSQRVRNMIKRIMPSILGGKSQPALDTASTLAKPSVSSLSDLELDTNA